MRSLFLSLALLMLAVALPAQAQRGPLPGLEQGTHYTLIEGGAPYRPQPGKIEVVEVFAYWCPHCAHLQPKLETWKATLPKSVTVTYMPATFYDDDAFMLAFFAAEQARAVPATHARLFAAIHETGELPKTAKLDQVAAFYTRLPGVDAAAFRKALADTSAIAAKVDVARAFQVRSKIPGTPALIVDGRYLVLGNSYDSLLANTRRVVDAGRRQPQAGRGQAHETPFLRQDYAMTTRLALLLCALLPLAACSGGDKPTAPAADAPATAAAPVAQQASAEDPAAAAAAEAAAQAAADAAAKAPPLVPGTDYVEIPNGQPFDTTDGRIEVAEIFGYVCPFCASVQPTVRAMKAKFPADVHMVYVPAAFGSMWDNYAKAYYTAEAMGLVDATHDAMFRAIHLDKTLKGERGMDTPEEIAAFYAAYGADPRQFVSSMSSFAVAAKVNRAKQFVVNSFNEQDRPSTPTFIVNGKYRVKGKTVDEMFRILNQLVVAERAKAAAAPAPAAAPAADPAAAQPAQS